MRLLFVSQNRFEVGARVGWKDGSFFREQRDAIKHQTNGGGHAYEVKAEQGDLERGEVSRWLGSVSGVKVSFDEDEVFKAVPDME